MCTSFMAFFLLFCESIVFVAAAVNQQNGTGPSSEWTEAEMPEEEKEESQIVGAPAELRVLATHDSVQVSWLPPWDNNVLIRGYLVGWGINIPDVEKANVEPEVRHFTIRGLKPNREYVISLRAYNRIGHGFPIYETVKTSSYAVHPQSAVSFSEPKSTFGGFGQQHGTAANTLVAPVGVVAEAISSSQVRLSWIDPNENAFNQMYTIKYGISNNDEAAQHKLLNTSETELTFDGLRPDTLYEFAVRLVQSPHWSLNAVNRTFSAPPSSPPRDLTVIDPQLDGTSQQQDHNTPDGGMVTLTWQPPKYANGEIQEYIVLYSDRPHLPDREWVMDSVKGDRLSIALRGLRPGHTYHCKLQARNVKGYGPFTPVTSFITAATFPAHPPNRSDNGGATGAEAFSFLMAQFFGGMKSNLAFVLVGVLAAVVVLLLVVALFAIVCFHRNKNGGGVARSSAATTSNQSQQQRRNKKNRKQRQQKQAYIPGRKMSVSTPSAVAELDDDLWMVHQQRNAGGRFATLVNASTVDDYDPAAVGDESAILLIDGQQRTFITPANAAGLNFQSGGMECMTPTHYQQAYHAATQRQGAAGDGQKGALLSDIVGASPQCQRGMMESFHSMTTAIPGDSPKSAAGAKQRKQHRNSLPPHSCPSNSATILPPIITDMYQHCPQYNHNHYAQSALFGVRGAGNFGRRSDSPVGFRHSSHHQQRVAGVRMHCGASGRIGKSSLNALDLSISPSRLGHAFRQTNDAQSLVGSLAVAAVPSIAAADSLMNTPSNNMPPNHQQQQFQVGIGLPSSMALLQVKHAKRTLTANYAANTAAAAATRRHAAAAPVKSVNFAPKLVIVPSSSSSDDDNWGTAASARRDGNRCSRSSKTTEERQLLFIDDQQRTQQDEGGRHVLLQNATTESRRLPPNECRDSELQQKVPSSPSSVAITAMDSVGTLSRGHPNRYHLHTSSASLEMSSAPQPMHIHQPDHGQQQQQLGTPLTPRNPHVVYTRVDRQPIAKMDFSMSGMPTVSTASNAAVGGPPPPPSLHDSPHNQQRHAFSAIVSASGTPPLPPPSASLTGACVGGRSTMTTTNSTSACAVYNNRSDNDGGYQTVGGGGGRGNAGGGTMRSFLDGTTTPTENDTNCSDILAPPGQQQLPPHKHQQQRMAHVVRPIVYAGGGGTGGGGGATPSPTTLRSAIGQPQAQKTTPTTAHKFACNNNGAKVPIGRATVQPRVNLAAAAAATNSPSTNAAAATNSYGCSSAYSSQYASVRAPCGTNIAASSAKDAVDRTGEGGELFKAIGSTEDLQEIDQMIETLQQLQHDFTGADNSTA